MLNLGMMFLFNSLFALHSLFLIFLPEGYASAPANKVVKSPPLKLSWAAEVEPQAVGWRGLAPEKLEGQTELTIERKSYAGETLELIYIPKDKTRSPRVFALKSSKTHMRVTKEMLKKIEPDSLWLWGVTPESHCFKRAGFTMRILNKKSLRQNLKGLFLWELKKAEAPLSPIVYLEPLLEIDNPESIVSRAFQKASERAQKKCEVHRGGRCHHIFKVAPAAFGKRQEILFKPYKKPPGGPSSCPV